MNRTLLITKADIIQYRDLAYNFDDRELDNYIWEAQVQDLAPILNPYLYNDLLKTFCDKSSPVYSAYQDLLNGVEYDDGNGLVCFYGIKPMLVYFTYARVVEKSSLKATRTGMVVKSTDESTPGTPAQVSNGVTAVRSLAITYQEGVKKFLCDNKDIYPLYNQGADTSGDNNQAFEFGKAQRVNNRYTPSYNTRTNYL